ncbi:MAG TPA: YfiR family protein [Patescibacteria group bacterium]|nr:YfiR family protein [Patescibacteria group bacterium]
MGFLRSRKFLGFLLALHLAVLGVCGPVRAQDQPLQLYEEKIKAGLLYNFLKYTSWPTDSAGKGGLRVCLLGDGPFDTYLYPLQGRMAQQYVIAITKIANASEAGNCSLVYIHRDREDSLPQILQSLRGRHVLTVSDIDQFAAQGGMVEFGREDQKIDLLINKNAVDAAGLNIQARLLKLAKLVPGRNG